MSGFGTASDAAAGTSSLPVAFRLYLPEAWIQDRRRRKRTGVPKEIQFRTKPEIALEQIRHARERGLPEGVVLADTGYGTDTGFRAALTKMEVVYLMGVMIRSPLPEILLHNVGRSWSLSRPA